MTVHAIAREAGAASPGSGVTVRTYQLDLLSRAKSLEDLSRGFGADPILYDPTRVVRRLRGLVRLAAEFRRAARWDISQIAYEPRTRLLYVVMTPGPSHLRDQRTGALLRTLAEAARRWQVSGIDCHLPVRLCERVPPGALVVPVDRASLRNPVLRSLGAGWRSVLAAVGLSTAVAAPAAAQAVKDTNFTTYAGVTVNSGAKGDFGADIAVPLTESLGAQLDLGAGTDGYLGAGGQLFLRDPNLGLVGLTASVEALDDKVMYRFGAKAEYYLDKFTLGGHAGWQSLEHADGAFGGVDLSFYATPDFALRGGVELSPDLQLYSVGAEWRPGFDALPGLSIYSDFEHDSEGQNAAKIGLIYHFGEHGVSLMDRDRKMKTNTTIFNRAPLKYVS